MNLELKGKRALVTGASRGLGYATARRLALEGCDVALNSRSIEKLGSAVQTLAGETDVKLVALPGDLSDPSIPAQLIQQTIDAFGGLDILVTNAGGPPPGSFETFDDPQFGAFQQCARRYNRID